MNLYEVVARFHTSAKHPERYIDRSIYVIAETADVAKDKVRARYPGKDSVLISVVSILHCAKGISE